MRICAVSLPELRVELVRAGAGTGTAVPDLSPLAIVVAPPPLTEQKLLGNTRIDVVSPEARARGVRPGQTIAQARAKAGSLAVRVVRPDAIEGELARLAEIALAFGATVSFKPAPDVLWVDVTGCAHLHAPTQAEGEALLAARLAGVVSSFGHTCAVAIADGPRVAAILAHAAAEANARSRTGGPAPVVVVPPGENARALEPLPIAVLPLEADDTRWLSKVGVRTIGELRALPRSGLATRLGPRAASVLALADGEDRAPLSPYLPPSVPIEETRLEYGIEGSQALVFVAKTLADRLSARLAGRAVAAARLELTLDLDVAMLGDTERRPVAHPEGEERGVQRVVADLPEPLSSAGDLLASLRTKIERLVLRAPVLSARLSAPILVHKPAAALSLFEPRPKAERSLGRLVAELSADLGDEAVGILTLGDSWAPEGRSTFQRFVSKPGAKAGTNVSSGTKKVTRLVSSIPEPTRILSEPVPVDRERVRVIRHLTRLESVSWWKPDARPPNRASDYVYGWLDDGAAWLEIDRASGAMRLRGWFD